MIRQCVVTHAPYHLFLMTVKRRRYATESLKQPYMPCGMFLIASLPKKCARTR